MNGFAEYCVFYIHNSWSPKHKLDINHILVYGKKKKKKLVEKNGL